MSFGCTRYLTSIKDGVTVEKQDVVFFLALSVGTNDIPEDRIKLFSDQHWIVFEGVVKKFFGNLTLVVRDTSEHFCNPIQLGIGFGKLFISFFLGRDQLCQEFPNFFFGFSSTLLNSASFYRNFRTFSS